MRTLIDPATGLPVAVADGLAHVLVTRRGWQSADTEIAPAADQAPDTTEASTAEGITAATGGPDPAARRQED